MRIDKYLWCVRLQKTRSRATKFIEAGNVKINGEETKKPVEKLDSIKRSQFELSQYGGRGKL